MNTISVLCLGDVVGRPGREAISRLLPEYKKTHQIDLVIVNAENSAGGAGIEPGCAKELKDAGVDLITLGDHSFQRKEARPWLTSVQDWCIRPANFAEGAPGRGWTIFNCKGKKIGLFNLLGRVFIPTPLDCPFRTIDRLLSTELSQADIIIGDMHAEATSEKLAMAHYLDGRISLLFGTHTHVQTADHQIFPKGTGYVTDLGMTGNQNGVIGMDQDVALARFLSGLPHAYKIAEGPGMLTGIKALIEVDHGKTIQIEGVRIQ